MPIEVYGDPSALFLVPNDAVSKEENWMITVVAEERYRLPPQPQNLTYRLRSSA